MSATRPILIVSYYFPPRGGAGTQRFAKFTKWLGAFGYRPVVVTADPAAHSSSAQHDDATLLADLPGDVEVIRVPSDAPAGAPLRDRMRHAAGFRADHERWTRQAKPYVIDAAQRYDVSAVITTLSPYAAAELGPTVRRAIDVPWLVDLRDPWALDGWRMYPSGWHATSDLRRMRSTLLDADAVIANTPASRQAFIDMLGIDGDRIGTIPNGFDHDDFAGAAGDNALVGDDEDVLRIIHVGTLHDPLPARRHWRDRLRRSWRSIEPTARSGRYLLEALALLHRAQPMAAQRIRLELVGQVHPHHHELAERLGITAQVRAHGYQTHRTALSMMQQCDASFVPLHGLPNSDAPLIVPAKLYEALAGSRFVLGSMPSGDATRLIETTHAGVVCPPTDVEALSAELAALSIRTRTVAAQPDAMQKRRVLLQPFERRALTARLAGTLDAVLAGRAIAGDDPWVELERHITGRAPSPSAAPATQMNTTTNIASAA